jgi:cytochrome c oxidase cbb3-type subunit 3
VSSENVQPPKGPTHHVYDGIEEQDNRLPAWWLLTLFGAMVFAAAYWIVYHTVMAAPLPMVAYLQDKADLQKVQDAQAIPDEAGVLKLSKDPAAMAAAQKLFTQTCTSCHGQNAEGVVGPNLTDGFWIHGGKPMDIHASVSHGYPEKGMPPWAPTLGNAKVAQLAAYVVSLKGKNLPGKAPQGDPELAATP